MKGLILTRLGYYAIGIIALLLWLAAGSANAQVVVDRTIATVSDGVRTELITRSDLMWHLALEPGMPIDPPGEPALRHALQHEIELRIYSLEAARLPRPAPTGPEIADKVRDILSKGKISRVEFERRLKAVGFSSIGDANFERIMERRVEIENYLKFRFESFVVVTAEDEAVYYRDVWVPDFKRKNPAVAVPSLEEARALVNEGVVQQRVAANMETFIEEAKRRVQIVIIAEPTA